MIEGTFRVVGENHKATRSREPAVNMEALCVFLAFVAVVALARYAFLAIH